MVWNAFMRGSSEYPAIDLWTREDGIRLHAQLPGVAVSDIDLSVVGDTVTFKGTRPNAESGRFVRTVQLPFPVESEAVRARFQNGVLEVELPRAASDKPRKITVQST